MKFSDNVYGIRQVLYLPATNQTYYDGDTWNLNYSTLILSILKGELTNFFAYYRKKISIGHGLQAKSLLLFVFKPHILGCPGADNTFQ